MSKAFENKLYIFKGFTMKSFEKAWEMVLPDSDKISVYGGAMPPEQVVKKASSNIQDKCYYLMNALIRGTFRRKDKENDRGCQLIASILQSVLGKEYNQILLAFARMGYISFGAYSKGRHSRMYYLDDNVEFEEITYLSRKVHKYMEKTKEKLKEEKEKTYFQMDEIYGEGFAANYLRSLRKIRIEDIKGFKRFEKKAIEDKPNSYIYYRYVYVNLQEKKKDVYKVGYYSGSHRIYHVLTSLKREAKQYLNIDFALDASNSQPLLFCIPVLRYYDIDNDISYNLFNYIYKNQELFLYHYDSKSLYNYLKNNYIDFSKIAKLEKDVLWYFYLTCTGRLWDWLSEKIGDERDKVKEGTFAQVYYCNGIVHSNQRYAKFFKKYFPTVVKLINRWKETPLPQDIGTIVEDNGIKPEKETGYLAIFMQQVESEIMGTILRRIYAKRWDAINLHDCIIVPKSTKKNRPSRSQVIDIMKDVYKSYGLVATFK